MKKIILGMSGGVDSSVCAWLLQQDGYQVEGLFMKNWEHDDKPGFCASATDLEDAQRVCDHLNLPLHTVNFSEAYWQTVFESVLDDYAKGLTPNPDVLCNRHIKFNLFLTHAKTLGADAIATGHYAKTNAGYLYKPKDRDKDQTYFLHAISGEALSQTYFPLADYLKSEVRALAKKIQLPNHDKKDSTGLCFIGERPFKPFLNEFILAQPGPIHTLEGDEIGQHDGVIFYTIGQRQGLKIGGQKHTQNEPWYVVEKDLQHNILYVAQGADHPRLYAQGLCCDPIHWIQPMNDPFPKTCYAKTRYRQAEQACMISALEDHQHIVLFSTPQKAITPGQYIVFYDQNKCLGGAVIRSIIQ